MPTLIIKHAQTDVELCTIVADALNMSLDNDGPYIELALDDTAWDVIRNAQFPNAAAANTDDVVSTEAAPEVVSSTPKSMFDTFNDTATSGPEYAGTSKLGNFSVQDYLDKGWTYENLLAQGYVELVEVVDAPEVPELPANVPEVPTAAPEVPSLPAVAPDLLPTASGASFEQFIKAKWTVADMISQGYLLESLRGQALAFIGESVPDDGAATAEDITYPVLEDGQWFDKAGIAFNVAEHSEVKGHTDAGHPVAASLKTDGTWKAARKAKGPGAPSAPTSALVIDEVAPQAPNAPQALPDPEAVMNSTDSELENIIKDWSVPQ